MPLFEVETNQHIVITWAETQEEALQMVSESFPGDQVVRVTRRPRNAWVISKAALGITGQVDPCATARDCLAQAAGDKVQAIRLYMQRTGADLEKARKVIETNMVLGW